MLPVALHVCTMVNDTRTLLRGMKRADGSLEILSTDDQERCLDGLGMFEGRNAEFNHRMLDFEAPEKPACATLGTCRHRIRAQWNKSMEVLKTEDICESEIQRRALFVVFTVECRDTRVRACDVCRRYVASSNRQFLEEMWNDLPAIMGLEVSNGPPNSGVTSP